MPLSLRWRRSHAKSCASPRHNHFTINDNLAVPSTSASHKEDDNLYSDSLDSNYSYQSNNDYACEVYSQQQQQSRHPSLQ